MNYNEVQVLNGDAKRVLKPVPPPTVTGAKGGNAALTSLIAALVQLGLITDTTS